MSAKPLTGRKFFFIVASAFGVIIAVNMTLAYQAVATFPGLEAKNGFVASQHFQADRAAQLALGWNVKADVSDGMLTLSITDHAGQPVHPAKIEATLGRATHVNDDMTPEFTYAGGVFTAPAEIGPGNWNLRLLAHAEDGTPFRQRVVIYKRPGA